MQSIFDLRNQLIGDYASYICSFLQIRDPAIRTYVEQQLQEGMLWPEPLIQLNPLFAQGASIDDLTTQGILHRECASIFRTDKSDHHPAGKPLHLHHHQAEAIRIAHSGASYILTTGTGSGKSLAYMIPIVDRILRNGPGQGIQAIVVYPMNALANSQKQELEKFLCKGYSSGHGPVTFARYTGQEREEERQQIVTHPPDILLTNYVMLELILTRTAERRLLHSTALQFLVLDELHTYRGRQGADVALLVRRVRDRLATASLQCVGTSATLAGEGSYEECQAEVASMATQIFGTAIEPRHVIGEKLIRTTRHVMQDDAFCRRLTQRVQDSSLQPPKTYHDFIADPLSIWIEHTFGVTEEEGRIVRTKPRSISGPQGAARDLSERTGVSTPRCIEAIQEGLLAGYACEPDPQTGRPPFAFRLHQFISKGDTMYASLEEPQRYLTLQRQYYVPGDRSKVLLPLVFCRECGQEYYCVRLRDDQFLPRELNDQFDDEGPAGFLYHSLDHPWLNEEEEFVKRLPDDWLEDYAGGTRVKKGRKKDLPQPVRVGLNGERRAQEGECQQQALDCSFVPAPFRFCLHCGVSYGARQTSDFAKLASLSSEGRSTATTILSLSTIRHLREAPQQTIPPKLLSFTDNRQDASLQAGHFNDFIEVGVLRAALYHAVKQASPAGIEHDTLTQHVFDALALPPTLYASELAAKYQKLADTNQALRNVLGYRLYRDLKRGWRITSPNLEQCGLLTIRYHSLEELSRDEDIWSNCHPALCTATPQTRQKVSKVLLDYMRRELAIKVEYLDQGYQERIQRQSSQHLITPWALDENETPVYATILFPRASRGNDYGGNVYLSARGGFGQYLRRRTTFPDYRDQLHLEDTDVLISQLLEGLKEAGLVERVVEPEGEGDTPGYQVPASAMTWLAGEGTAAFHDPIRIPRESSQGHGTNPFFVEFYRETAARLHDLQAREHTAQVPYELRLEREEDFRHNRLPILYCSPTMELGVDIAELNIVNMRNIPPTPANYAQRSGRAGRSGQPALVFSYCTTGSPHDQYFFKQPEKMVAGVVTPPRLDLTNEDLVRAHVQAIWLAETHLSLGRSLRDILEVSGDHPSLSLLPSVQESIEDRSASRQARVRAQRVLHTLQRELEGSDWYQEGWLDQVLNQITLRFDQTCARWRELYTAAQNQAKAQSLIMLDATRSPKDKDQAKRLRAEAESQLALLTDVSDIEQSDFYSYRYFASEGFLPGYNFPRLPLSAYIPGRRTKQSERDEYLSRPRFLAISEFGPRAIVYHEGSRYLINRVILSVDNTVQLATGGAKQCEHCGYLHPVTDGAGFDVCEHCGATLPLPLRHLFRLQNVATQRREKINSDEEERMRVGYDIRTAIRFAEQHGTPASHYGAVEREGEALATLTYGQAATLWRINLGWMRRKNKELYGFVLDTERGYWARNEQIADDSEDPMSAKTSRVIPYVEDRRNCLLFQMKDNASSTVMASLQAALKNAIQVKYQLEDNELAAEPLPNMNHRHQLLLYEAAEGGAGVLKRLIEDAQAMREVAREALRLCHFNPDTGEDLKHAPRAKEACEAACYDCLLSYYNQRDHRLLDRKAIREVLLQLAETRVVAGPTAQPRPQHFASLLRQSDSELERQWLGYLEQHGYRLPSHGQPLIASCGTRPDFCYEEYQAVIYVDGPYHDYPERRARDQALTEQLEDEGYLVIRFGARENWEEKIAQFPNIFGRQA